MKVSKKEASKTS